MSFQKIIFNRYVFSLLAAAAIVVWLYNRFEMNDTSKFTEIRMDLDFDSKTVIHFFYDIGNGINENDSKMVQYPRENPITIELCKSKPLHLRFDPVCSIGEGELRNIKIRYPNTQWTSIDLRELQVNSQFVIQKLGKNRLQFVSNGDDPITWLEDLPEAKPIRNTVKFMMIYLVAALFVFLNSILLDRIPKSHIEKSKCIDSGQE